jgi:hypothetical protein
MYEHKGKPLLPRREFLFRLFLHGLGSFGILLVSLFAGVFGYHVLAGLGWTDSLLNASMILGGMGPVDTLQSNGAKVFASIYALFSGVIFIAVMGLAFAPIFHRLLHRFHLEDDGVE